MGNVAKKSLDELASLMPIINELEQQEFVGGLKVWAFKIKGGTLTSYDFEDGVNRFTVYDPDDDSKVPIVFENTLCYEGDLGNCAYQFSGIMIGPNPGQNFDIGTMIHEYGHSLQQNLLGTYDYLRIVGAGSLFANIYSEFGGDYYDYFTEQDASRRGQAYIDDSYPGSGYRAEGY